MICPKCKAQIPDDARECPKCHLHQTFNEPLDFSARREKTIEHKEKSSMPSNSSKNIMFIMIVVLLLAITLLAYYLFANNPADNMDAAAKVFNFVQWGLGS